MKKNIVVCVLTAIGIFLFAFGYAGYADADFFYAMRGYLPTYRFIPYLILSQEMIAAGFSTHEVAEYQASHIMWTKFIGLLFITAGTVTLVSAFLYFRHSEKQ